MGGGVELFKYFDKYKFLFMSSMMSANAEERTSKGDFSYEEQ